MLGDTVIYRMSQGDADVCAGLRSNGNGLMPVNTGDEYPAVVTKVREGGAVDLVVQLNGCAQFFAEEVFQAPGEGAWRARG